MSKLASLGGTFKGESHLPPQRTLSQMLHHRSFTPQMVALGYVVRPRIPGIQMRAMKGTMNKNHLVTIDTFNK